MSVWLLIFGGCQDAGPPPAIDGAASTVTPTRNEVGAPAASSTTPVAANSPASADDQEAHERMVAELRQVIQDASSQNTYFNDVTAIELRKTLDALSPKVPKLRKLNLMMLLGGAELSRGNELASLELLNGVHDALAQAGSSIPREILADVAYELGVANLRRAETENCCARNTPESCIFPIQGGGIHTRRESAEKAVESFTEVLALLPANTDKALSARWMLNIAHMTLGQYPDRVPAEYLIPLERFAKPVDFPRFRNVAQAAGVDTFSLSGSVIADDFDNDGDIDLLVSSYDVAEPVRLFRNDREQGFVERTEEAGLLGILGGLNMIQGDYNNDGFVDVYILRGAWWAASGQHPDSLLRNNGDGTFHDVSFAAGMGPPYHPSQTGRWADFDNDGWLDFYVGNESTPEHAAPSQLYHNNRDGTFTDIAAKAGVTNDRYAKGVAAGDYDGDGDMDIYVSNLHDRNRLYRNNGDLTFTDVAESLGVDLPLDSFPAWFWDFDNDGNLDIYVTTFGFTTAGLADFYANGVPPGELPKLYRGDGAGHFEDVAASVGLTKPSCTMGTNFGDLDNDGFLDFYLGTGAPKYSELMPNQMYWNRAGKEFTEVTLAGGFGHLQKGHGIAFADLDLDGDQDVFEQMGGALRGDKYHDVLYENPGFSRHWIVVKLVGTRSNRSAIGARIQADFTDSSGERSVYRWVGSGASFGANPLRQSIGLSDADRVERLTITWPSGLVEEFHDLPAGQLIEIVECQGTWSGHPPEPFSLTGPRGRPSP